MFSKAQFLLSCAKKEQFPTTALPEIAFAGRSNVGKSSLINHLTKKKMLAKVSQTPGKTQLINFFEIDEAFLLVDLPGYGFAKVAKAKREGWGELIEEYLSERENLKLIILLIDLRHPPSKEDLAFLKWAHHFGKPLLIVLTKSDKISKNQLPHIVKKSIAQLEEAIGGAPLSYVVYSIK